MSSCAASCCTHCPGASSASVTSASSPTAAVPLSCHFAFNYSARYRSRRWNNKHRLSRNRAPFGSVPNVAVPWWSSRDFLLPSSNSVLHHFLSEPLHETPIAISLPRCLPSPASVVRPSCPIPSSWLRAFARKLQSNHSGPRFDSPHYRFPESLSLPKHH